MTDILDHLQPDRPFYEATRDAASEEIIRLRSRLNEMAEARDDAVAAALALKNAIDRPITQSEIDAAVALARQIRPQMDEAAARTALTKYRGNE